MFNTEDFLSRFNLIENKKLKEQKREKLAQEATASFATHLQEVVDQNENVVGSQIAGMITAVIKSSLEVESRRFQEPVVDKNPKGPEYSVVFRMNFEYQDDIKSLAEDVKAFGGLVPARFLANVEVGKDSAQVQSAFLKCADIHEWADEGIKDLEVNIVVVKGSDEDTIATELNNRYRSFEQNESGSGFSILNAPYGHLGTRIDDDGEMVQYFMSYPKNFSTEQGKKKKNQK